MSTPRPLGDALAEYDAEQRGDGPPRVTTLRQLKSMTSDDITAADRAGRIDHQAISAEQASTAGPNVLRKPLNPHPKPALDAEMITTQAALAAMTPEQIVEADDARRIDYAAVTADKNKAETAKAQRAHQLNAAIKAGELSVDDAVAQLTNNEGDHS